jgi:hypothetical protein
MSFTLFFGDWTASINELGRVSVGAVLSVTPCRLIDSYYTGDTDSIDRAIVR